jgi:hypothetical protein
MRIISLRREEKRIQNGSVQEDPHYGGRKQRNKSTSIDKRTRNYSDLKTWDWGC